MQLSLLRHGQAVDVGSGGGATDEARTLTPLGVERLTAMLRETAPLFARPDRIVHSPYVRAVQSAQILARVVGFGGRLEPAPGLVPGGNPAAVLADLSSAPRDAALALVGHEPFLGRLLALLLTGNAGCAIPMRVGMLAVVHIESSASMLGELLLARGP